MSNTAGAKRRAVASDIMTQNRSNTGFRLIRYVSQENSPYPAAEKNLQPLTAVHGKGWRSNQGKIYQPLGHMQETLSAITAVKRELPNTRKRLNKETYRCSLLSGEKEKLTLITDEDM